MLERAGMLVVTRGEHGSSVISRAAAASTCRPCRRTRIADPTGVGDAYRGGFMKGLALGADRRVCARLGSVAATYALEHLGGQSHAYTWEEFQRALRGALRRVARVRRGGRLTKRARVRRRSSGRCCWRRGRGGGHVPAVGLDGGDLPGGLAHLPSAAGTVVSHRRRAVAGLRALRGLYLGGADRARSPRSSRSVRATRAIRLGCWSLAAAVPTAVTSALEWRGSAPVATRARAGGAAARRGRRDRRRSVAGAGAKRSSKLTTHDVCSSEPVSIARRSPAQAASQPSADGRLVAGWLVPGAGHFLVGQIAEGRHVLRRRCSAMFVIGLALRRPAVSVSARPIRWCSSRRWRSGRSACRAASPALVGWRPGRSRRRATYEYGNTFLIVARPVERAGRARRVRRGAPDAKRTAHDSHLGLMLLFAACVDGLRHAAARRVRANRCGSAAGSSSGSSSAPTWSAGSCTGLLMSVEPRSDAVRQHLLVERDGGVLTITSTAEGPERAERRDAGSSSTASSRPPRRRWRARAHRRRRRRSSPAPTSTSSLQTSPAEPARARRTQALFDRIERLGKPVIAAVNGCRSAAAASWRWRARSGSPPTRRSSASPKSTSGYPRLRRIAAAAAAGRPRPRARAAADRRRRSRPTRRGASGSSIASCPRRICWTRRARWRARSRRSRRSPCATSSTRCRAAGDDARRGAGLRGDALRPRRRRPRTCARARARFSRSASRSSRDDAPVHECRASPSSSPTYHAFVTDGWRPARARRCARPASSDDDVETFLRARRLRAGAGGPARRRVRRVGGGRLPRLPHSRRDAALRLHRAGRRARHHARGAGRPACRCASACSRRTPPRRRWRAPATAPANKGREAAAAARRRWRGCISGSTTPRRRGDVTRRDRPRRQAREAALQHPLSLGDRPAPTRRRRSRRTSPSTSRTRPTSVRAFADRRSCGHRRASSDARRADRRSTRSTGVSSGWRSSIG